MQPEAGPSRAPQRFSPTKGPVNGGAPDRGPDHRWNRVPPPREREREWNDRGPGQRFDNRFRPPPHPPSREYGARPPFRSRTPSPPHSRDHRPGTSGWDGYDRDRDREVGRGRDGQYPQDIRDRLSLDTPWTRSNEAGPSSGRRPGATGPDGDRYDRGPPPWAGRNDRSRPFLDRQRGLSPSKQSARLAYSPPRGPSSISTQTPPSRPGSRAPSNSHSGGRRSPPQPTILDEPDKPRINFLGRDFARALERDKQGQGLNQGSHPIVITRSTGVPRSNANGGQRMVRQSSSPGAPSRSKDQTTPPASSSTPQRVITLPRYRAQSETDLEEGELVSPTKSSREYYRYESERPFPPSQRGNWRNGRGSISPVKRPPQRSPPSPRLDYRDDRTEPAGSVPGSPRARQQVFGRRRSNSATGPAKPTMTSTRSDVKSEPRRDRRLLPMSTEIERRDGESEKESSRPTADEPAATHAQVDVADDRPDTPAMGVDSTIVPAEAKQAPSAVTEDPPRSSLGLETHAPSDKATHDAIEAVPEAKPVPHEEAPIVEGPEESAPMEGAKVEKADPKDRGSPPKASREASDVTGPEKPTMDDLTLKPIGTDVSKSISPATSTRSLGDQPVAKSTIAERRAVQLPQSNGSLSSPFNDVQPRQDPMPSYDSTKDVGTPPAPPAAVTPGGPVTAEAKSMKQLNIVAAIKSAQAAEVEPPTDAITKENAKVVPTESSRVPTDPASRPRRLREPTWPLSAMQVSVSMIVTKKLETEKLQHEDKIVALRRHYLALDKNWQEHCRTLDASMELRGPPPSELYATPNAIPLATPAAGPGAIPMTPGDETFSARANRRRGAGDAVATEAEFQEILLTLQDTAAKDPTYRASKTTAVVPDLLDDSERQFRYDDENDLVTDPLAFYDFEGIAEPQWTDEERAIFLRRYLTYPKQFGKIADGLPNKSASDCVLYYYRTKKNVDYKSMLASRRGDKKKKVLPIKKGGKSSALLANLEQKKRTVNASQPQGPKSHITPAKKGELLTARQRVLKEGSTTPSVDSRRKTDDEDDGADTSAAPSRAGSEVSTSKAKMRMSVKAAKRSRMSSINGLPNGVQAAVSPTTTVTGDATTPATTAEGATPPAELLPPVKRAGKKRKVETGDPSTPGDEVAKPARRNATNSYWSVEEKRKFKELYRQHGSDTRAIAAELQGKSERQVANYHDAHKDQIDLAEVDNKPEDPSAPPGSRSVGDTSRPVVRSIYDAHPSLANLAGGDNRYGPQLGTFPSPSPASDPSRRVVSGPPNVPAPRAGGMPLSAMLNDATEDARPSSASGRLGRTFDNDNASDATVSERDGENGVTRPSPRSVFPSLAASPRKTTERLQAISPRRSSFGAVYDRHLSKSGRPFAFETPASSSSGSVWRQDSPDHRSYAPLPVSSGPPRPSTVAPANPYQAGRTQPPSWDNRPTIASSVYTAMPGYYARGEGGGPTAAPYDSTVPPPASTSQQRPREPYPPPPMHLSPYDRQSSHQPPPHHRPVSEFRSHSHAQHQHRSSPGPAPAAPGMGEGPPSTMMASRSQSPHQWHYGPPQPLQQASGQPTPPRPQPPLPSARDSRDPPQGSG